MSASSLLRELQGLKYELSPTAIKRKVAILGELAELNLASAEAVYELHECLCYLRAYPPDARTHKLVGNMLHAFEKRSDLRRFSNSLADSGIAGTKIFFRFFWLTAIWLAQRGCSSQLTIDWQDFVKQDQLPELLHLLLPFSETPALDCFALSPKDWLQKLKGPEETDAGFLIDRFESLTLSVPMREKLYEDLDIPMQLDPGPRTPARGRDEIPQRRIVYQTEPPSKKRPDLKRAMKSAAFTVKRLSPAATRRLIDLADSCMVSRHRDLLIFLYADPRDGRLIDFGDGLQFLCVGAVPERRLMLESVYGFLTLMNGYPIGYVLCSAAFNSAEVAYNVFETFRGRGAADTYARILAMVSSLFAVDTFALDPYQLGHNNAEGQDSGAWWFYYKLGFRPRDPYVKGLVREELAAMKQNPKHRSSAARLNEMASEYMFLHLGKPRRDVLGELPLGEIGLRISEYLAQRFGSERERGIQVLAKELRVTLGLRKPLRAGEKLAWERWAPLALALPGLGTWTDAEKQALVKVILAKGGRSESEYVLLLDRHQKLRRALLRLVD